MPFRRLEKHDYEILESYWINFKSLVEQSESNPERAKSIKNIIAAVTTLYNASNGDLRRFIEQAYFDAENGVINRESAAVELNLSKFRISRLKKSLLEDTAKLISWV